MQRKHYDVIIVGAGIMGACTAYYLMKTDEKLDVAVIERDPTYTRASTTLSMANIRVQFGLKENIQISRYALEVFKTFGQDMEVDGEAPDIGHHMIGNLFLVDEAGERVRKKDLELQQSLGCKVEWWPPEKIVDHYPLYNTKGYVGATFGA
ncbi:MAG: FAD-dependent oxidoreductase, partial [Deltaproteobacteria bacterium]